MQQQMIRRREGYNLIALPHHCLIEPFSLSDFTINETALPSDCLHMKLTALLHHARYLVYFVLECLGFVSYLIYGLLLNNILFNLGWFLSIRQAT